VSVGGASPRRATVVAQDTFLTRQPQLRSVLFLSLQMTRLSVIRNFALAGKFLTRLVSNTIFAGEPVAACREVGLLRPTVKLPLDSAFAPSSAGRRRICRTQNEATSCH
jgi:hypothetical protein